MKSLLQRLSIFPMFILANINTQINQSLLVVPAYVLSFSFFLIEFLGHGKTSDFILVPIVVHGVLSIMPVVLGNELDPGKLKTMMVKTGFVIWVMIGLLAMWSLDMLPWSIWWILSPAILVSIIYVTALLFSFLSMTRKFLKEITKDRLTISRNRAWKSKNKSDKTIEKFKSENRSLKIELKKLRNQSGSRQVKRLQRENANLKGKLVTEQEKATGERGRLKSKIASLEEGLHKKNEEFDRLLKEVLVVDDDPESSVLDSPPTLSLEGERILLVGGSPDKIGGLLGHVRNLGGEAFHDNKYSAKGKVKSATAVICWVKFLSHDIYYSVKQTCKSHGIPMVHWNETSLASLERVITIGLEKNSELTL